MSMIKIFEKQQNSLTKQENAHRPHKHKNFLNLLRKNKKITNLLYFCFCGEGMKDGNKYYNLIAVDVNCIGDNSLYGSGASSGDDDRFGATPFGKVAKFSLAIR